MSVGAEQAWCDSCTYSQLACRGCLYCSDDFAIRHQGVHMLNSTGIDSADEDLTVVFSTTVISEGNDTLDLLITIGDLVYDLGILLLEERPFFDLTCDTTDR